MRMLRWHYRSKHQSLIAVSNRQFYENKLFIVPSPYTAEAGMGLRFHHVPQGIWDAGGTRTNAVEAKVVAQAIIAHAREHPGLSLGVATFSTAQRRAIMDNLELMRRTLAPEVENFFQKHPSEPFFVKNLENVQGDERDVIFISVGYGPTVVGGRVPMRFGPLGTEGGERRLNVLISRAKQRCEVFSSMTDEDIDPDFASTRKGVFAFRMFMHFARTGRMTMAESTGRDHDSVFEEQVAKALQARGLQVHRQVGLAGFFIDLAVADKDRPGRYLLGIECDGASYHGARSARDRDRLRQSVLESHGWNIHRIWSTDWFQRPNQQIDLILERIEAAKAEYDAGEVQRKQQRAVPVELVSIERDDVTEIGFVANDDQDSASYMEAIVERPAHLVCELHETPRGTLAALAEEVVETEGPVHVFEVVNRIRDAWGLKRAGGRIQDAVEKAIDLSVMSGRLLQEGDFLTVPGRKPAVRDRSEVRSASLRRIDTLPPSEVEIGVLDVVRFNFGASEDDVCTVVSRRLGFKSTSSQLKDLILQVIASTCKKGWVGRGGDGLLVLGADAPAPQRKEMAPSPLALLIAEGEHEKLEFKETLRWDVALGQPNKKLEEVVVKTVAGFFNRMGGTLLIGVTDAGEAVGLQRDFDCLGGSRDKFELHLTTLFANHFGHAYRASKMRISFPEHDGVVVCRIDVDRASQPMFVNMQDRSGNPGERFFVRSGNSTQELSLSQLAQYLKEQF
jgi:very-short-patch-repair endonuclease